MFVLDYDADLRGGLA